jgi:hypothetical protein
MPPSNTKRILRCLEYGMSVLVGTVDADGNPSCCRAVGLTSNDELATATVFVPIATSQDVIASVGVTHRIAVVTTQPIEHCATQLKGVVQTTRLAHPDEEPFVRTHLGSFAAVLNTLGYPPRVTNAVAHWPAFAIEMRVDEIFEQSPGPKAGTRLR